MAAEPARLRCNNRQKEYLVDFMSTNRDLALGTFSGPMGAVEHQLKWSTLAEELASIGPNKSVEQWITTWRDIKSRSKSVNAARVASLEFTGNPERPVPKLTPMDLKVLSIIGHTTSAGMQHVVESAISGGPPIPSSQDELQEDDFEENVQPVDETASLRPPPPTPFRPPQAGPSRPRRLYRPHQGRTAVRPTPPLPGLINLYAETHKENMAVLKDISKHLERKNELLNKRNEIEEERNKILVERNKIQALNLQFHHFEEVVEEEA